MTGFVLDMTWFVLNMTGFVLYMSEFLINMTGFVLDMTGFVRNMTGFVLNMTGFDINITEFVLNMIEFYLNITGFVLNMIVFVLNIIVFVSPDFLSSRKGNHGLLLNEFIQLGLRVVDTVPAGTDVMQVRLQDGFSPSSLHTLLHPVVAVVMSVWVSVSPRVYE